jgi:hypothetical protein
MRVGPALLAIVSGVASAQTTPPPVQATPAVILEKTRFAVGERVFCWIEITTSNSYVIPSSLMTTGRVHITRPDGATQTDVVVWPIDGMGVNAPGDQGWRGGRSLGAEPQQLGRHTVVFEFAGKRSEPKSFTIEDVDLMRRITATFVFPSPLSLSSPDVVTFTVRNGLAERVVFAHRGQMTDHVSYNLKTQGWGSSGFVPTQALLGAAGVKAATSYPDVFGWASVATIPTVALAAGETYSLRIPVRAVLEGVGRSTIPAGTYELTLHTELKLLIGAPNGPWKEFEPLRLSVASTTTALR